MHGASTSGYSSHRRLLTVVVTIILAVRIRSRDVNAAPAAVGIRRLHDTRRLPPRQLKYIFTSIDEENDDTTFKRDSSRLSSSKRSTSRKVPPSFSSSSTSSSKLHDIVNAFQQAVAPNTSSDNVHVGKLLTAMSKMETHMRQVGMTQAANDLKGNYEKVMKLYTAAPIEKRDSVRGLLEWELKSGIHGGMIERNHNQGRNDPIRVKNNSGAMGLFWIGHTVKYQHDLYRLMMDDGMNPIDAATIAFQKDLQPHLPWAASKMARAMIPKATPSTQKEFLSMLGGYKGTSYGQEEHQQMTQEVKSIIGVWSDLLDNWSSPFDELRLRDI